MIKVVLVRGGIGNQMFCYAFTLSLKSKFPLSYTTIDIYPNVFDHRGFELHTFFDAVNIKNWTFYRRLHKLHTKFFTKIFFYRYREKSKSKYDPISGWVSPLIVFEGFWQTAKYFENQKELIKSTFKFNISKLNIRSITTLKEIQTTNSVSVHIRRGDYLDHENNYGNICTAEYYRTAINLFTEKESNIYFYFFSDDPIWVKNNFPIESSVIIDFNIDQDSWQDMCLISYCKHNIIANSTFSWWGAWLNNNTDKVVVAPKKWTNNSECPDIIPSAWIKV
jgi:hypothetical protein